MVKLNLSPTVEWVDLVPGVRVKAAPATSAVMDRARHDPLMEGIDENTDDRVAALAFAKAVAKLVIEEWEGVEDDKGAPAPIDGRYVEALLDHYAIYQAWHQQYLARWLGVVSEKNASAPAPTGTSAGAKGTARRARRGAKSARTG